MAIIVKDGKSLQTYFTNIETSQRITPHLSSLYDSEVSVKKCDQGSDCKIMGGGRKLGFHKFVDLPSSVLEQSEMLQNESASIPTQD